MHSFQNKQLIQRIWIEVIEKKTNTKLSRNDLPWNETQTPKLNANFVVISSASKRFSHNAKCNCINIEFIAYNESTSNV